jgi:hypothetical protein
MSGRDIGRTATDAAAALGAVLWVLVVALGTLDTVRTLLALGLLVVVPLAMRVAATPAFEGPAGTAFTGAALLLPLAGPAALASLTLPPGVGGALAVPWVVFTLVLAAVGLFRLRERGFSPLHETAIDAGFLYAVVGAGGLLFSGFGIYLWFEPVIVLLAGVHFTFAGLVLPVLTGAAGRALGPEAGRLYRALAAVVIAGPAFIGVGISFSPAVEVVSVGFFTIAVALLGGFVALRVAPELPRAQGALVALSALVLPVSMAFALAFGVAAFTSLSLPLDIATMVRLHGTLNALGFALCGAVGWRLAPPSR